MLSYLFLFSIVKTYLIYIQYGSLSSCTNHHFVIVQQLYRDIQ
jgi:hypothetical protein